MSEHHVCFQEQKMSIMVVAILIAGMAYQTSIASPGGVWPDRYFNGAHYFDAGTSVLGVVNMPAFNKLYTTNTVAFIASLSYILFLTSGLLFIGRGLFLWILTVVMWAAITSTALTYAVSIAAFTPPHGWDTMLAVVGYGIVSWTALMFLLLLINHTVFLVIGNHHEKTLVLGKEEQGHEEV